MILTLKLPAGPHELFSHDVADNMPGQSFEAKNADLSGIGQVLEAEVIEYGRAILLTVEWPDSLWDDQHESWSWSP